MQCVELYRVISQPSFLKKYTGKKVQPWSDFFFWETEKTAVLSEKASKSLRAASGIVLKVKAVVMRVNGVYFWSMRMHEQ